MIKRELGLFLIVGSLTALVDFSVYRGLLWISLIGVDVAKGIGFLTGTLFAYFANRFCTFGHRPHAPGSAWRFSLLYFSTLIANVVVNALALKMMADAMAVIQIAFLIATAVSASLNFLGMKFFVFNSRTTSGLT
jgi:putative flippase GtrA